MSTQTTSFPPSSVPHTPLSLSVSKPSHIRTQTSIRSRPILTVVTPTNAISASAKPGHSKTSNLLSNTPLTALRNMLDTSTARTLQTKASSAFSKQRLAHASHFEEKSKGDSSTGILDLTSVPFFKTEPNMSGTEEGPSGYVLHTRGDTRKTRESFIKELDGNKTRVRKTKTMSIEPLEFREIAKEAQSKLERPSQIMDQEIRTYLEKMRLVDIIESRKMRMGGVNAGRKETALATKENAMKVMGLSNDEKQQLNELNIEDQSFFTNVETVLVNALKRIERIKRLSEDVELKEGEWVKVEADSMEWRYCFVDLKGKAPPLQMNIRTRREVKLLRVLASKRHKRPHKYNCDYEFENKKIIKIFEKDRRATAFEQRFFYFAVSPDESGFISINVEFGELEMEKKPLVIGQVLVKKEKPMDNFDDIEEEELNKETRRIRSHMRYQHLKLNGGIDIIEENKNLDQYTPERRYINLEERKYKLDELIRSALQKKVLVQKLKKQKDLAFYLRWDVIRALKGIVSEKERKQTHKMMVQKSWVFCVALYQVAEKISVMLAIRKKAIEEKQKQTAMVSNMMQKIRHQQKPKGEDYEHRLILEVRQALTLACRFIRKEKKWENRKKGVEDKVDNDRYQPLVKFVQDLKATMKIQKKLEKFIEAIKLIQTTWKAYFRRKQSFMSLIGRLWERNFAMVFEKVLKGENTQSLGKLANARTVLKKFNADELRADQDTKEKFVNNYIKHCTQQFLKRSEEYHKEKHDKNIPSLLDILKSIPSLRALASARTKNRNNTKKKTRLSIMAEIEQNSLEDHDAEQQPHSMEQIMKPPRLFVLPNQEDLEEFLVNSIVAQVTARLPRGSVTSITIAKAI